VKVPNITMVSHAVELKPKFNRLAGYLVGILGTSCTLNHSVINGDIGRRKP